MVGFSIQTQCKLKLKERAGTCEALVLNRGGKGVRSPLDGLKSSSGKVSYTDLHKTPG